MPRRSPGLLLVAAPRPLFAACLAVIITTLAGGIARADYVLPDTPANRARGVVGCTQTDTGINCGGGGGGPSEDPGDYYERRGEPANYVNVIRSGNSYRPAPGYRWVNDDPKDFSVVPYADGTPDRDNPNVVWAGDATRRPAPGYGWVSDAVDDLRVELIALEADPEILALAAEAEAAWETSRAMLYDGRWAEAEYYLRQYLAADPDDAWMHSRLGYALLKQGRYAEAVEASRQAAKLAPHESAFQGDLILSLDSYAWTRALDGEMGEARALYSQAIELARGDAELTSKLAGLLNETYRAGAALADGAALLDHRNSSIRSNGRETPCSLSV